MRSKNSLDTQNRGGLKTILTSSYKPKAEPRHWHQLHCVPKTSPDFTACLSLTSEVTVQLSQATPATLFILTPLLHIHRVINGLLNLQEAFKTHLEGTENAQL